MEDESCSLGDCPRVCTEECGPHRSGLTLEPWGGGRKEGLQAGEGVQSPWGPPVTSPEGWELHWVESDGTSGLGVPLHCPWGGVWRRGVRADPLSGRCSQGTPGFVHQNGDGGVPGSIVCGSPELERTKCPPAALQARSRAPSMGGCQQGLPVTAEGPA